MISLCELLNTCAHENFLVKILFQNINFSSKLTYALSIAILCRLKMIRYYTFVPFFYGKDDLEEGVTFSGKFFCVIGYSQQ